MKLNNIVFENIFSINLMCSRVFSPVLKKGLPVSNHMSVTVYGCKIKTYFLSDKCY